MTRLEAFSDGVFAIVVTLLVLDLRVPTEAQGEDGLAHYLRGQWPSYLAFLASFLVVGTIWLNHHAVLRLIDRPDHGIQLLNLCLLLTVTVIPFPTALLADYAGGDRTRADQRVAVLVYGGVMVAMSVAFNLLWRRVRAHTELQRDTVVAADLASRHRRFNLGLAAYPLVTLIGLIDVRIYLVALLALAGLYLLPTPDQQAVPA